MTEPAIRMAARVSPEDARSLAAGMRTYADFILDQKPHHFACYIQDVTKQALSVSASKKAVDDAPRLSAEAYQSFLLRNRSQVSAGEPPPRAGPPPVVMSMMPKECTKESVMLITIRKNSVGARIGS